MVNESTKELNDFPNLSHIIISLIHQIPSKRIHEAFTSKSTYASGELIYSPIGEERARHIRDAFVKGIYGRLFIWIVGKINSSICGKPMVRWLWQQFRVKSKTISHPLTIHLLLYIIALFHDWFKDSPKIKCETSSCDSFPALSCVKRLHFLCAQASLSFCRSVRTRKYWCSACV